MGEGKRGGRVSGRPLHAMPRGKGSATSGEGENIFSQELKRFEKKKRIKKAGGKEEITNEVP